MCWEARGNFMQIYFDSICIHLRAQVKAKLTLKDYCPEGMKTEQGLGCMSNPGSIPNIIGHDPEALYALQKMPRWFPGLSSPEVLARLTEYHLEWPQCLLSTSQEASLRNKVGNSSAQHHGLLPCVAMFLGWHQEVVVVGWYFCWLSLLLCQHPSLT